MPKMTAEQTAAFLHQLTRDFLDSPANDAQMPGGFEPAFGPDFLLGYAAGDDPIWKAYQNGGVGPEQWTPLEAYTRGFPGEPAEAVDLTVIVWILPQTKATISDQRREKVYACERWARSRFLGQGRVVDGLAKLFLAELGARGIPGVAPDQLPGFSHLESSRFTISSPWSHRHAAHAAGLGTFGLCDGFISPLGKAIRLGSLVVKAKLPITLRPYSNYREYCLFFNSKTCGRCIQRCPAEALSPEGHDKRRCRHYTFEVNLNHIAETWPDLKGGYACGLCQVAVPCATGIPKWPKAAV